MKDLETFTNQVEKTTNTMCSNTVTGAVVGGAGTFALLGLLCPIGALAIPATLVGSVIGGSIGKKMR